MRCLRCGYPKDAHCKADGSCMWARCGGFVEKWPDEAPAAEPAPVELEAPAPTPADEE